MCTEPNVKIEEQVFQARLKANEFVQGFLKQLIAVASAAIVLSVTFLSDVFGPGASISWKPLLYASWSLLGLAVVSGVVALSLLVNNLDVPDQAVGRSGLRKSYAAGTRTDVTATSGASIVMFLLGLVCLAVFAAHNFSVAPEPKEESVLERLEEMDKKIDRILDLATKVPTGGGTPVAPGRAPATQQGAAV